MLIYGNCKVKIGDFGLSRNAPSKSDFDRKIKDIQKEGHEKLRKEFNPSKRQSIQD